MQGNLHAVARYMAKEHPTFQGAPLLSKGSAAVLGKSLLELPRTETELEEPEMKGEILVQIQ